MNKSEKFWDRQSAQYDTVAEKYWPAYDRAIEKAVKYLDAGDTVLDYGCGTGITTREIAGKVREIYAIDISSGMIDAARRKADELKIENINYARSTIFDDGLEGNSFSAVLAFNILHLIEDAETVVQRINELLRPNGLFISTTACMGEKLSLIGILSSVLSKIGIIPYTRNFRFFELEDLVAGGSFRILETENLQHSPPNYFIAARKPPVR